jgi:hypothetical protein
MTNSDRNALMLLAAAVAAAGYHFAHRAPSAHAEVRRQPIALVAVCDVSDSGSDRTCTAAAIASAATRWAEQAERLPGSSFEVILVGDGRDGVETAMRATVPERWGPNVLAAQRRWREGLVAQARGFTPRPRGSAIVEALGVAAQSLHERRDARRTLLLMSDLRQVTPRVWNFERGVPRRDLFVRWLTAQRLGASLQGIALRVCGVHPFRASSRVAQTAALDGRRRALWSEVFAEMGAPGVELRAGCDDDTVRALLDAYTDGR